MLYITTKGNRDAFTAHRTLCSDIAPDNGYFLPMRFPQFSQQEIRSFIDSTFEETIARILNIYFSGTLTKWDVELCIGRNTARVLAINPNVLIAQLWHNSGNSFNYAINSLFHKVFGHATDCKPSEWFCMAVKIAVWFGIYGELCRRSLLPCGHRIDLSIPADDFSYPVSALYAQDAGLPIGNIVCNCTESHRVWDLIHRGEMNANDISGSLKASIERFLLLRLGESGVTRFLKERLFKITNDDAERLSDGLFCVVSSLDRIYYSLNGVYTTNSLIVSPNSALCLAGLGDYRAKIGESRLTLVLEDDSPILFAAQIEKSTGIPEKKLNQYLRE